MKRYLFVEAQKQWEAFVEGFNITIPLDIVQPMGLVQLAAMIREKDPEAELKIIDLRLYKNDYSTLEAELREFNPEFVGFRIVSRDSLFANDMIQQIRGILPRAVLVGGGPHVTAWMGKVLEETPLDFAVYGEGETTLLDFLEHVEAGGGYDEVDGLIYRDSGGQVRINKPRGYIQNLDVLPLPAWDLLDHEKYFDSMYYPQVPIYLNAERNVCSIFTSRACPYGCTFCHSIFGKRFRAQSPEKTIAEIEYLYHVFGIRQFDIRDDIFNFDRNRVIRICDLIHQKKLKLKLTFPNGLRGDIMDKELVLKLKEAGMYRTTYALETASPRIQKMIKKNINLERLQEIIRFTSEQDIIVLVFVMLGFPTETREELMQTVEYTLDPALDFALIHSVNPFEGTEMAGTLKEEGIDIEEFRARYDYLSVNFSVCKVSAEELQEIKSNLIKSFFTEKRFENLIRKLMLYAFKG